MSPSRRGTRVVIASTLRSSLRLLRARWIPVLVATLCVQGTLLWVLPLIVSLVRWTLETLGIDGVNLYTLDTVATSALAMLVFMLVAVVATLFVLAELTLFAVIAHLSLDGETVTFRAVLGRFWRTARKGLGWQGLLLVPYLTLLLPISQIGISSAITRDVTIPKFIAGELLKSPSGTALYLAVMAPIAYLMLQLLLFPTIISGGEDSITGAMRRSIRMTHWRALLLFGAAMLATSLVASLVLTVVAAVGLAPVYWLGTTTAAGMALGMLEMAHFLVSGAATAFVSFFFTTYLRNVQDLPHEVVPTAPTGPVTRVVSTALVVAIASTGVPQVFAQVRAAEDASGASPVVIGHRGYPDRAVENSIEGLRAAAAAGADMVETDIQETRDGEFVVMHDVDLTRLTGDNRKVHELTAAEVTALTLRQNGMTARIPMLDEFVVEADRLGVVLLVEVKPHGREEPGFTARVADALDELDPDHTHMVQSLDRDMVEEITRLAPNRPTAYVVGFQLGSLPATSADAVVLEDWSVQDHMIAQAAEQGRLLFTWTVNDIGPMRDQMTRGVDGLVTDRIEAAVATRERLTGDPVSYYVERAVGLMAIGP